MFCKNCGAELEDHQAVCPSCGQKTESNDKTLKLVVSIVCLLLLAAVLVFVILTSLGVIGKKTETTPTENVQQVDDTQQTTGDTQLQFPSYSADDATIEANRDTVIATSGDYKLTGAQLQINYWFQVYMYCEKYRDYISMGYIALDLKTPLSEQACAEDSTISWEEFFLDKCLTTWHSYAIMNMLADEEGYELEADMMDKLKADNLADAQAAGYDSVEAYIENMLKTEVGASVTVDDYWEYMEFMNRATAYFGKWYDEITPSADEMEAYYKENEETFVNGGAGKDAGSLVDVRHILLMVDENTDAAWQAANTEAERILQEWKDGGATEELFAQLANKYSDDGGSNTAGGLYTDVQPGQMVEVFNDWIMDSSRVKGDTAILKADYHYQGYHIMYFVEGLPIWENAVSQTMITEKSSELLTSSMEKWPIEKNEESIKLGIPKLDS